MISDFKTAKCLLAKAQEFADANNLDLAITGEQYDPKPDQSYVTETLILNTIDPLGMSGNSGDMQLPIYQLSVFTPKHEGQFIAFHLADLIRNFFPKASFLFDDGGQKIQVESTTVDQPDNNRARKSAVNNNKTHNQINVSINLIVFASNT